MNVHNGKGLGAQPYKAEDKDKCTRLKAAGSVHVKQKTGKAFRL